MKEWNPSRGNATLKKNYHGATYTPTHPLFAIQQKEKKEEQETKHTHTHTPSVHPSIMAPSKIRKEEADLRQIAKQARLVRKEAKARERKQKQREARMAAKAAAAGGETAAGATKTSTAAAAGGAAARKPQGAIILPDEVKELRQRFNMAGEQPAATKAASPSKKKGGKAAAAAASSSSPASSSSSPVHPEPNHSLQIHFKNKQVIVEVVLHRIPHQKINVSETTATTLVVDTTTHTKRWRLVLPMPHGITVKLAEAEYDFEGGVLKCTLPIDGEVPAEAQKGWDDLMSKMQAQKALRFRTGKDGELTVRTRSALLAKNDATQAVLRAKELRARKRGRSESDDDEDEEEEDEAADKKAAAPAATPTHSAAGKAGKKPTKAELAAAAAAASAETDSEDEDVDGTAAPPAKKRAKKGTNAASNNRSKAPAKPKLNATHSKKNYKADVFAADHAMAMEAAKAAAATANQSIRARVKLARTVQAQRQERISHRSDRKDQKQERKEASFLRVIDEQKRQLSAKAQLAAATEEADRQREKAKNSGIPSKTVSFA